MTLVMRTAKGAVSFEWSDEDAETVVKIEPTDADEVMVRKLKRVIALAAGEQPQPLPVVESFPPEPRALISAEPVQTGNGWAAAFAPPEVPERLQGEVELIPPGEEV